MICISCRRLIFRNSQISLGCTRFACAVAALLQDMLAFFRISGFLDTVKNRRPISAVASESYKSLLSN